MYNGSRNYRLPCCPSGLQAAGLILLLFQLLVALQCKALTCGLLVDALAALFQRCVHRHRRIH